MADDYETRRSAAAKLRAQAEADTSEETVVERPATPPGQPEPDLKQQVLDKRGAAIERARAAALAEKKPEPVVPGYGTMMAGIKTGEPGNMGQEPSKALELGTQAHNDISTAGGQEPAGAPLAPPRIIASKGGMVPSTESTGVSAEAAPLAAQQEYKQGMVGVTSSRLDAEAQAGEEGKRHQDQMAEIQGQVQEYQEEQHRQQLDVAKRQMAVTERHEELMAGLEKEIAAIPNAPRTIREKLEQSGVGDRIAFGFAAGLAVLGSGRNGGQSAQNFINNVRGSIDALVQKEKDQYEKLGEKAKRFDNVYERAYKALGDQSAALEVTRKLYMEAADAALKEQMSRYAGALTGPNAQKAMAEWKQIMLDGSLKAAGTVKRVAEKTSKYVPPTVRVVYDPRDPRAFMQGLKKDDYEKLPAYRKYLDDRGQPEMRRAERALANAVKVMPPGFNWKLFVTQGFPESMTAKLVSGMSGKEAQAIQQNIQAASNEMARAMAGLSRTRPEVAANFLEQQLFNKDAAAATLRRMHDEANIIEKEADTAFRLSNGASVGTLYRVMEQQTQ